MLKIKNLCDIDDDAVATAQPEIPSKRIKLNTSSRLKKSSQPLNLEDSNQMKATFESSAKSDSLPETIHKQRGTRTYYVNLLLYS